MVQASDVGTGAVAAPERHKGLGVPWPDQASGQCLQQRLQHLLAQRTHPFRMFVDLHPSLLERIGGLFIRPAPQAGLHTGQATHQGLLGGRDGLEGVCTVCLGHTGSK